MKIGDYVYTGWCAVSVKREAPSIGYSLGTTEISSLLKGRRGQLGISG